MSGSSPGSKLSDPDEKGMRTVMCVLNGQMRPVSVCDRSIESDVKAAEKADPTKPGSIATPFAGAVTITVEEGATVKAGDTGLLEVIYFFPSRPV